MKLQRLLVLSAMASLALAPVTNAQNTQGPLPKPAPIPGTAQPLPPGGPADTSGLGRLRRLGSIVGIDGGLFVVTVLGLIAITNNNDPANATTPTTSTTSTSGT